VAVDNAAAEQRVASLEEDVQELRQQVEFLEKLLRQRQVPPSTAPASSAEPAG
jgi:hypothetical protein